MESKSTRSRKLKIAAQFCCAIVGVVFIVSGFTKAVDPWGTAIKINEYLSIYGIEWLSPIAMVVAIWLCGAEMMMGCMLLFKVRIRLISIFALVSMSFFIVLTLLSATLFPVEDCGCFGDAIKLTPWQTFFKNLVLLPMIVTIWYRYRPDKIFIFKLKELILAILFFTISMGVGTYSYFYLPIIDFLPYKIGVNLREAIAQGGSNEDVNTDVTLVYRNLKSGELKEFSIDDTEWYDDSVWEWVETRTEAGDGLMKPLLSEFSLRTVDGIDATADVLSHEGRVYIICVTDPDDISKKCEHKLNRLIDEAYHRGDYPLVITPKKLVGRDISLGTGANVDAFNIDASTMTTVLRASVGVIELEDGVIVNKKTCWEL